MPAPLAEDLAAEMARGGAAAVRNLALAEAAVVRGQFNLAKVLRALAHTQRVQALHAARILAETQDPDEALATIAAEVALAPPSALGEQAPAVRASAQDLLHRAQRSLGRQSDVSEWEVAQELWGCYGCGLLLEGDPPDVCPVCGALAIEFEDFGPFYSRTAEHLGQLTPAAILAIVRAGPERVAAVFTGTDERLLETRPSADAWCPKELVGHLMEVERLFVRRVETVLTQPPPAVLDAPVPPWVLHEGLGYETMPAQALLAQFRATRTATMELLERLQPDDWGRQGIVGGQGISLLDLGTWLANHDRGHLAQLQRPADEGPRL